MCAIAPRQQAGLDFMLQSQHAPGWSPRQNRCCHLTAKVTKWYRLGFSLEVSIGHLGAIQLAQSREVAFDCIKDHAPEDLKILSMRCFGNRRTQAGKKLVADVGFSAPDHAIGPMRMPYLA